MYISYWMLKCWLWWFWKFYKTTTVIGLVFELRWWMDAGWLKSVDMWGSCVRGSILRTIYIAYDAWYIWYKSRFYVMMHYRKKDAPIKHPTFMWSKWKLKSVVLGKTAFVPCVRFLMTKLCSMSRLTLNGVNKVMWSKHTTWQPGNCFRMKA